MSPTTMLLFTLRLGRLVTTIVSTRTVLFTRRSTNIFFLMNQITMIVRMRTTGYMTTHLHVLIRLGR